MTRESNQNATVHNLFIFFVCVTIKFLYIFFGMEKVQEFWTALSRPYKLSIMVLAGLVTLCLFSSWSDSHKKFPKQVVQQMEKAKRQATQLYQMSIQDSNPMIALIHVNYALAYLHTIRSYGSPEQVNKLLAMNVQEMIDVIEDIQQKAIQTISQKCPALKTDSAFTITSGWV
jgi:hypothetical protein